MILYKEIAELNQCLQIWCNYKDSDDYEIMDVRAACTARKSIGMTITDLIEKHFPEMWEKIESINWAEIAAETRANQKEYQD
jgi:hypothetical protein